MPQPPALTPEQRQAALAKAAKVRRERAEVKEKLKLGSITLSELLTTADANETVHAWRVAVDSEGPTALILSRQDLPVLAATAVPMTRKPASSQPIRAAPNMVDLPVPACPITRS